MMTLHELVSWLRDRKGSGEWAKLADASGVTHNTISRIARGYMKSPSVVLVERLSVAIQRLDDEAKVPV